MQVPFVPGRTDASQDQTDIESFNVLRPRADAFRNYYGEAARRSPADMMVDKADLLTLSIPETTVLVGGMRLARGEIVHVGERYGVRNVEIVDPEERVRFAGQPVDMG